MGLYRVSVTFGAASQIPADNIVNTFHFFQGGPLIDGDNVRDIIKDFYAVKAPSAVNAIGHYMSTLVTSTATVRMYSLDDPKPRPPRYESTFTFSRGSAMPMPREVAMVVSYQAPREAGELQSRRRNRWYVGPLNSNAMAASGGLPAGQFTTDLRYAAKEMLRASAAAANWQWKVYSPTNNEYYDIDGGWVDNAWDTQRRRGEKPTVRGIWDDDTPA